MSDYPKSPVLDVDPKFLHPYCLQCIKENTTKHPVRDESGEIIVPKGVFPIRCHGILNDEAYKSLTEDDPSQYEVVRCALDRAYWAKKHLGWKPRVSKKEFGSIPYQEVIVNCTAYRKVYRLGRRLGKCFDGDSYVQTSNGLMTWKEIFESEIRPSIVTLDLATSTRHETCEYEVFDNGVQPVYRVQTTNGVYEQVTGNHPFLVMNAGSVFWIEAQQLKPGMEIVEHLPTGMFGNRSIGGGNSKLLGYVFAADHRPVTVKSADYEELMLKHGISFIRELYETPFPSIVYSLVEDDVRAFLQAAASIVGSSNTLLVRRKTRVQRYVFDLNNFASAVGIQRALGLFGIYSSISTVTKKNSAYYRVLVNDRVSLYRLYSVLELPVNELRGTFNIDSYDDSIFGDGCRLAVVSNIECIGDKQTYGVHVPKTNIIAGLIITHNTEAIAIEIVHDLFTSSKTVDGVENADDTVITPGQTQRDEIMQRVRDFMYDRLGVDKNEMEKDKNTPFPLIKTKHKSSVKGLVTGTAPGSQGTSIRSQGGDKLILDEAAFFSEDHYAAFLALLSDHPDVRMIVSSTPKGKSSVFYKWCHDPFYKEFHFPSIISPLWIKQIERELKKFYGPINYQAEIMAEFIDEDASAFPDQFIERMFRLDQDYNEISREVLDDRDKYYIGMGVDWNGHQNGTQIYLMARDKKTKKKRLIWHESVHDQEQTQLRSVNKVRELNTMYRPDFIYIDIGFGHTQYELLRTLGFSALRKYGAHHPDAALYRKLTPIAANKSIEVIDKIDKNMKRTIAIKPFMVEIALMDMENGDLIAPHSDETLQEQMKHYHLVKVSSTGNPIYKGSNRRIGDHALDAFMLCNLGFRLEYDQKELRDNLVAPPPVTVDPYIEILVDPVNYADADDDELRENQRHSIINRRKQGIVRAVSPRSEPRINARNRVKLHRPVARVAKIRRKHGSRNS